MARVLVSDILIEEGVPFTILTPTGGACPLPSRRQRVERCRGGRVLSTSKAYRYFHRDGSGRSMALFFYDSALARSIAFEGALVSSQGLIDRFERDPGAGTPCSRGNRWRAPGITRGSATTVLAFH